MAIDILKNIAVTGIACCVPENITEVDSFVNSLGESAIEKFKKTTGVNQKHCCTENNIITAGDLCYQAAEELIQKMGIERDSIDALILVTQSADYIQPSTACVLQYRLNLSQECLAYDVNLGCSGYVYGLHLAGAYLQSGKLKRILLLCGEANVHVAPESSLLFGEAGSATLIESAKGNDMNFLLKTIGSGFRSLLVPYGAYRHGAGKIEGDTIPGRESFMGMMDGAEVFNFTIREVPKLVKEYNEEFQYTNDTYDLFLFHQANLIILEQLCKKLKLPKEKTPVSLDIYGNTSSASIPLGICDYFNRINSEAKEQGEQKVMVCGFGIGLSLGVTSFMIDGQKCFPVIKTNEAFEDGVL